MDQAKVFAFLALLFASVSSAAPPAIPEGDYIISIYAQDLSTSQYIINTSVQLYSRQTGSETYSMISERTRYDGMFTAYLDQGSWEVLADIDDPSTPGKDLVAVNTLNISKDSNFTMVFQEVGSAYGDVSDEQGQIIEDADITLNCVSSIYNPEELNDELKVKKGSFSVKYLPAGACRITLSSGSASETFDINLKKGELKHLTAILQTQSLFDNPLPIAALILGILILAAIAYLATRPKEKPKEIHPPLLVKTKKVLDVMKTLNEREKQIVELLLDNEGVMKQSKICARLLIPKTTLSRTIRSLEARNILRLKPMGKTNLIELTEWFKS